MGKVVVGVARNIVDPTGNSYQYLQKKTTGTMLLDILRTNRFSEITSIGHTDDYTAVAVSGSIVGVDIEEIVPVLPETDTYVRSFLQEECPYLDMVADNLFIEWTA